MELEAIIDRQDIYKVVLEESSIGIFIYVYKRNGDTVPHVDYLQDDWARAKDFCDYYLKIDTPEWGEVPLARPSRLARLTQWLKSWQGNKVPG